MSCSRRSRLHCCRHIRPRHHRRQGEVQSPGAAHVPRGRGEWLDSMAMHQADVIMQTGGTIGDPLCASCPWFFGMDTWVSFPLSWRQDGGCSYLSWPFSALLNNFACDTAQTNRLQKPTTTSLYIEGGVCFTNVSLVLVRYQRPAPPVYTKYQSSIRNCKNLFKNGPCTHCCKLATAISETCASTSRIIWS